jgi:hypothetical protein
VNKFGEYFTLGLRFEHKAVIDGAGFELEHLIYVFVLLENLARVHITYLTPLLHNFHILQQGYMACGFRVSQHTLDHALQSNEIFHTFLDESSDICLHRHLFN